MTSITYTDYHICLQESHSHDQNQAKEDFEHSLTDLKQSMVNMKVRSILDLLLEIAQVLVTSKFDLGVAFSQGFS